MPSSKLLRQIIISRMRVVSPSSASMTPSSAESSPTQKQKRPSCATSNKFSKERLERQQQAQQKQERAPVSAAAAIPNSSSNKSHIMRSMSKLFGKSRGEPVPEPARGRPRQRRAVSGGSVDYERNRTRAPSKSSSTKRKIPMPRGHKAGRAPGYKPVSSLPVAAFGAVQSSKSVAPMNARQINFTAEPNPGSMLPVPKPKRGPSPLSRASWTSPEESVPRSSPIPVSMPLDADHRDDAAMEWEPTLPLPPLMTRSSTTSSSSGSVPRTPIDEDIVMVDVFDADSSADSDSLPMVDDKPAKPEDCQPPHGRPVKPLPAHRHPHAPVEVPSPPPATVDDGTGSIVASDSELERQLWADMNDILGHEDEPARFCLPPQEIPTIASLPAGVPPPIIASTWEGTSFPVIFPDDVALIKFQLEVFSPQAARATPDVVVTPATSRATSRMHVKDAVAPAAASTSSSSLDTLWLELFGPEIDAE
ncbi:hypothetical protein DAEQUDRAFT_767291 [Daedalea quercina L-15889]|uniref:Uncharacterized protein n=1 Tax=Daedalea quercina L-15889 TaxID=1314783 RepID=A0A165NPK6_9APHY|nr:hypothetical protein DAEQUDRAFT_767291 [Daedalea quercina L-15889]